QLELLLGMLVEQQVQLVEGRAGDQPVVLLVERVQDRGVGQDLVEQLAAFLSRLSRERDRQQAQRSELLQLWAGYAQSRVGRPPTGRSEERRVGKGWRTGTG